MKTETSKDAERKKVSVGLGDATAQEMVTTPSGTDKPTHEGERTGRRSYDSGYASCSGYVIS